VLNRSTRVARILLTLGTAAAALAAVAAAVSPTAPRYFLGHAVLGFPLTNATVYASFWFAGGAIGAIGAVLTGWARRSLTVRTSVAGILWAFGLIAGAKVEFALESIGGLAAPLQIGIVDPGMRLPLGFLCGGLLAWGWCRVTRASWPDTGDMLAVYASLLIAVGRTGCLLAGCCTGRTCPSWMAAVCLRYPVGSPAYVEQLQAGLIAIGEPMSRPIHVLPLYFALAAVAILAVLASLLRREAPPGRLLWTFAVMWPISKLVLEQFRATPRPPALMLGIPATILFGAVVVALARAREQRLAKLIG
jgi:prolipoprotein diacylglyceryltransferase